MTVTERPSSEYVDKDVVTATSRTIVLEAMSV